MENVRLVKETVKHAMQSEYGYAPFIKDINVYAYDNDRTDILFMVGAVAYRFHSHEVAPGNVWVGYGHIEHIGHIPMDARNDLVKQCKFHIYDVICIPQTTALDYTKTPTEPTTEPLPTPYTAQINPSLYHNGNRWVVVDQKLRILSEHPTRQFAQTSADEYNAEYQKTGHPTITLRLRAEYECDFTTPPEETPPDCGKYGRQCKAMHGTESSRINETCRACGLYEWANKGVEQS